MNDARKVLMRALQEARGCHRHPLMPWEEHWLLPWEEDWPAVADEVLAALAAAGLAVVPVEQPFDGDYAYAEDRSSVGWEWISDCWLSIEIEDGTVQTMTPGAGVRSWPDPISACIHLAVRLAAQKP